MSADRDTRRTLAQAATPGPWNIDGPFWWEDGECTAIVTGDDRLPVVIQVKHANEADVTHVAANDPAQVLADLDALDRADRIEAAAREYFEAQDTLDTVRGYGAFGPMAHRRGPHPVAAPVNVDVIATVAEAIKGPRRSPDVIDRQIAEKAIAAHLTALAAAGLHVVAEGHAVRDGQVWALEQPMLEPIGGEPRGLARVEYTHADTPKWWLVTEASPYTEPLFRLVEEQP